MDGQELALVRINPGQTAWTFAGIWWNAGAWATFKTRSWVCQGRWRPEHPTSIFAIDAIKPVRMLDKMAK